MTLANRSEFHATEKLHKIIWIFFYSETPSYCTFVFCEDSCFYLYQFYRVKSLIRLCFFFYWFCLADWKKKFFLPSCDSFFSRKSPTKVPNSVLVGQWKGPFQYFDYFPYIYIKRIIILFFISHLSRTTNQKESGTVTEREITPFTSTHFGETQLSVRTTVCSSPLKIGMKSWCWMIVTKKKSLIFP